MDFWTALSAVGKIGDQVRIRLTRGQRRQGSDRQPTPRFGVIRALTFGANPRSGQERTAVALSLASRCEPQRFGSEAGNPLCCAGAAVAARTRVTAAPDGGGKTAGKPDRTLYQSLKFLEVTNECIPHTADGSRCPAPPTNKCSGNTPSPRKMTTLRMMPWKPSRRHAQNSSSTTSTRARSGRLRVCALRVLRCRQRADHPCMVHKDTSSAWITRALRKQSFCNFAGQEAGAGAFVSRA